MYAIHTTPGFIVSSRASGEAGKLLSIFTKDLGLIRATAQGIRFEKSKLRPFIQDYSIGIFSFVRGKEYWRLTNAQEAQSKKEFGISDLLQEDPAGAGLLRKKELIARIALLINRLLQGEETHPELFITLNSLFVFLDSISDHEEVKKLSVDKWETLESLIVIRILHRLGYIANILDLKEYIESDSIDEDILTSIKDKRTLINKHINKALKESHL